MNSTASRLPLMTGFPTSTFGSATIRSCQSKGEDLLSGVSLRMSAPHSTPRTALCQYERRPASGLRAA